MNLNSRVGLTQREFVLVAASQSVFAPTGLRPLVQSLVELGSVTEISSVYRFLRGSQLRYTVCVGLESPMPLDALVHALQGVQNAQPDAELELLDFNSEQRLSPTLTLPHPEWLTRSDLLVPSAEVWGEYFHPVVEQPLVALAARVGSDWGEFHCPGRELLVPTP